MLNDTPQHPLDKLHRVRLDGRRFGLKKRIAIIREYFPAHYVKIGGSHYVSPEAANIPMEELDKLQPTFNVAKAETLARFKNYLRLAEKEAEKL